MSKSFCNQVPKKWSLLFLFFFSCINFAIGASSTDASLIIVPSWFHTKAHKQTTKITKDYELQPSTTTKLKLTTGKTAASAKTGELQPIKLSPHMNKTMKKNLRKQIISSCWKRYPFTYSKCKKLCVPNMKTSCLGDELCLCDPTQNWKPAGSMNARQIPVHDFLGVSNQTHCLGSDYCESLCDQDENLQALLKLKKSQLNWKTYGAVCEIEVEGVIVKCCVCNLIRAFVGYTRSNPSNA